MLLTIRVATLSMFFVFGLVFLAEAQVGKGYSLSGQISNAATGEKLPGTVLFLSDLKRSVLSDENGDYIVNPGEDLEVAPNSKIIVLGRPEQIEALNLEYNIL